MARLTAASSCDGTVMPCLMSNPGIARKTLSTRYFKSCSTVAGPINWCRGSQCPPNTISSNCGDSEITLATSRLLVSTLALLTRSERARLSAVVPLSIRRHSPSSTSAAAPFPMEDLYREASPNRFSYDFGAAT